MSKLVFWFVIMTILCLLIVEFLPGAKLMDSTFPQIAPPDTPKTDIDNPLKDPKVKQERELVNYIMDAIEKHVDGLDWFGNWNPQKEMDNRIKSIVDIIKKHGYFKENYYIEIKAMGNPTTGEIVYWYIEVTIIFKSNKDVAHIETFTIMEMEIRKPLEL